MINRSGDSFFGRPAHLISAGFNRPVIYPELVSPISYVLSLPVIGEHLASSRVSCLNFRGCPSAITGVVVSIDINSVKAVGFGRFFPHIRKKCNEVVPSFADGYSSPTVRRIPSVFGVFASSSHSTPRKVFGRFALAMGLVSSNKNLSSDASTRHRIARGEATTCNKSGASAGASAVPPNEVGTRHSISRQCGKSAECLIRKVSKFWHKTLYIQAPILDY